MYIDTSCLGSYYIEESHTKKVQSILVSDNSPIISSLTEVEFHSMLNKKVRMHLINTDQQNRIIEKFNEHLRAGLYETLPVKDSVFHAARWVLSKTEHPIHTLDSLHLGFSIVNRLTLFSTDTVMLDTATDLNIDTVSGI